MAFLPTLKNRTDMGIIGIMFAIAIGFAVMLVLLRIVEWMFDEREDRPNN